MQQHGTKQTRKGKTLIDHICSNIPSKLIHCYVIYADEMSDHDCPYTIFNIKKESFEPRYNYIRIEKSLNMNNYISDFKKLPTNLVYVFDEPDDHLDVLNNLINQCISDPASRPPAPWMKNPNHFENLRNTSRNSNHTEPSARQSYHAARNNYKKPYDPDMLLSYKKHLVPKI